MRHFFTNLRTVVFAAAVTVAASLAGSSAHAQPSLSPLVTFGSNGWLAPGSNAYLSTGNNERGLGWNPVTKNIVSPAATAATS